MNCKPGDLAVVTRSESGNEGKIVRVLRLHSSMTHDVRGSKVEAPRGPMWILEVPLPCRAITWSGRELWAELTVFPDAYLRPIGSPGDDARDETLEWLLVPSRDEVTA